MLREAILTLALVASIVAVAPFAPALPPDCTMVLTAEESAQNDADSGDDAPDSADAALRIPRDDYYWGYLSVVDHTRADLADWYVFAVPPGTRSVMANVIVSAPAIPTEAYLPDNVERFFLTLIAPDGSEETVSTAGGSATFLDPAPGDHLIKVWPQAKDVPFACSGTQSDIGAPATPLARNHGLYIGCNPICAGPATA